MRLAITIILIFMVVNAASGSEIKRSRKMSSTKKVDIDAIYYDLWTIYSGTSYNPKMSDYYEKKLTDNWNNWDRWSKVQDRRVLETLPEDSIDTIFKPQHNAAEGEIWSVLSDTYKEEEYNQRYSQDVAYYHLSIFYKWLENNEKSEEYWIKIGLDLRDTLCEIGWENIILPYTIDSISSEIKSYETIYDHYPISDNWSKMRYLVKNYQGKYVKDFFLREISSLYNSRAYADIDKKTMNYFGYMGKFPKDFVPPESYYKNMEISEKYYAMMSEEYRKKLEDWKKVKETADNPAFTEEGLKAKREAMRAVQKLYNENMGYE